MPGNLAIAPERMHSREPLPLRFDCAKRLAVAKLQPRHVQSVSEPASLVYAYPYVFTGVRLSESILAHLSHDSF